MNITGTTLLIAHIGYPTEGFKSPLIVNPWFDKHGINAAVIPMGLKAADFPNSFRHIFKLSNVCGALVTMPHKVTAIDLVDELSTTARITGSVNAVLKRSDGTLLGDMFDGIGFTRSLSRKGFKFAGTKCLIIGSGGVGSAIASSLAAEGVASISLARTRSASEERLADRLTRYYHNLKVNVTSNDPAGYDIVVNATPLGMKDSDPLPFDPKRLSPSTFVGEVVMKQEITPVLKAAIELGCKYQVGTDMLFEMIPAYLEFFGFGTTTPEELRAVAKIAY